MAEKRSGGWFKWAVILVVVGAAIAGSVWYFKHGNNDAPQYQTTTVARGDLTQAVTATGTLNPVLNVQVGCQVSGRISRLYVDYNSPVTNGQLIAEIDPRTYLAQFAQAGADLSNAKANLELQQVEARRSSELFTNKLVSGSDYDTAIANLHEAEAMVQIKEASLTNAAASLGYCKIFSPVDGVVISRNVDVGQTVAASLSAPVLFQIANDLTKMQIDANVAEADVGGIEEGQDVNFTVDAYPYRTFHGTVTQVRNAPITVASVVTYDTVIAVDNPDYKLKPGMTANASLIVAARENVLKIPNAALRFRPPAAIVTPGKTNGAFTQIKQATNSNRFGASNRQGRRSGGGPGRNEQQNYRTVYALSGDGKDARPNPVQIKVGITDGVATEVEEGLKEGDSIVTGLSVVNKQAPAPAANPFGGGFRRF